MKTLLLIAAALLFLVGCHHRKPAMSDAEFAEFRASNPGMTKQCLDENRYGGFSAWRPDDPSCFEMLPEQKWRGLWDHGWEWSNFCPDPAKTCENAAEHGDIWLTFAKGAYHGPRDPINGVYRIEFVGRRTKGAGNFGHQAQYDHLMVVDRLISIEKIPGEQYTKR